MVRYTKEQLIFYLQKLAKEKKATPTGKQMDRKKKYPSSSTYRNRFGSWNEALREAGLPVNVKTTYTKKGLINNLKQLSEEVGRIPKTSDLKKWTGSYSTYRKYFGSWHDALRASGLHKKFTNLKGYE